MGQIRITGGIHRSRKIRVEDQPGLRPTADRVRETLFNWLGQNLHGLTVLDLYAGSGILAFEAASRGAATISCVETNRKTIAQLQQNIKALRLESVKVFQQSALDFSKNSQTTYDILFLDPPFDSDEMNAISAIISPVMNAGARVYREYSISQEISPLEEKMWTLIKHKKAGQVIFELWQKKHEQN